MRIIRFTVRNHRSLRDEVSLELTSSKLTTNQPRPGETWSDYIHTLAGVFGPNATGKSNILHAVRFMMTAVINSSSVWQSWRNSSLPLDPFRLDTESAQTPSLYELEFLLGSEEQGQKQYLYSFEASKEKILEESLSQLNPETSRWKRVFTRQEQTVKYGSGIDSIGPVSNRELVLSRAYYLQNQEIGSVAAQMIVGFDAISASQIEQSDRLKTLTEYLARGIVSEEEVLLLLKVADVGITGLKVEEEAIPQKILHARFQGNIELEKAIRDERPDLDFLPSDSLNNSIAPVVYELQFEHRGSAKTHLRLEDESDGTLSWLVIASNVLETLRQGNILLVDEIDTSLHPHLAQLLLELFSDTSINKNSAQLLFTSHDITLVSKIQELGLSEEQVWFTEKGAAGETILFSLADFPKASNANYAKRYLEGRYGAVPLTSLATFRGLMGTVRLTV